MYPSPAVPVNLAVHAGDQMFAEVRYIGNHRFTLTLKNLTTGRRFSITRTGRLAERSSAEWVVEAPSSLWGVLPLANFGTAYLTHSQATIGGVTGSIGQFTHYAMTMSGVDDTVKAGFSVEWNSP
jgi:hypothetical protein